MSTEQRPAKRPREDTTKPELPIQRSPDYWLDDGSLVIQVESTQFRVARSMLATHSTVFRDMFSLPPPPADEPLIEGCPVVVLPGDKSEDWKHLLDAMYPKNCFEDEYPSLAAVSAILRLSNKYDIPTFRQQCIQRLKKNFPTTLEGYEETIDEWLDVFLPDGFSISEVAVHVINLGREVGLYSVLPAALYTIISRRSAATDGVLSDVVSKLEDRSDETLCLRAYAQLVQDYRKTPVGCFQPDIVPCYGCKADLDCSSAADVCLRRTFENVSIIVGVVEPWREEWEWEEDLCEACIKVAMAAHRAARQKAWDELPSYFGLPVWEELLKMDLV
ncbi:BTB domain-containing protein [Mycena kentingensis (nom. inval.)]|nr:BTB domain-containing protein [Mycena kentingensis (nom. inval.)]